MLFFTNWGDIKSIFKAMDKLYLLKNVLSVLTGEQFVHKMMWNGPGAQIMRLHAKKQMQKEQIRKYIERQLV